MKYVLCLTLLSLLVQSSIAQGGQETTWGYQPDSEICTLEPTAIHDDCVSNDLNPVSFRVFSTQTLAEACPSFQPSDCDYGAAVANGNTKRGFEFRGTIENCGGSTRPSAGVQSLTSVVPTLELVEYCQLNGLGTPEPIEVFPQVFCHDRCALYRNISCQLLFCT